jgi:tripartite-type tricarboxylate transporter receptor subunit TctC
MRNRLFCVSMLAAALALVASSTSSPAQTWPQRPVKFLVTLGPGSGIDIGTRLLADQLSKRWGQPVVVENRPGGDGIVAISAMVAAHDDHVLLASPTSSFTAHPFVYKNVPYKPEDLQPIARVSNTIIVIAVPADLPVRSLAELVALARAQPGKLNWAGTTGAIDFLVAAFLRKAGLSLSKVPYRNQVEAANDLAAGRIQFNETAYAIVRPQLQAGKVKLLAVTNSVRAPVLPDVPTVTEAGYPDLALDGLVGFFGPPEMPLPHRRRRRAGRRGSRDCHAAQRHWAASQLRRTG